MSHELKIVDNYFHAKVLFIAWEERSVWLQNTGSKNIQNVPFMHIYPNSKVRFAKICAFDVHSIQGKVTLSKSKSDLVFK